MRKWKIGILLLLLVGCMGRHEKRYTVISCNDSILSVFSDSIQRKTVNFPEILADTETEKRMREMGFVDIREIDSTIRVHLVYATADNFVGKVLYRDIHKALMLPETARRLADAQRRLGILRPDLRLMVYDAARPMSVQQEMWVQVRGTDKRVYVSNPKNGGGLHNYGAAVDLTIVDSLGNALPMGSRFDYFGEEARPDREEELVKQGKLSLLHLHNRQLLRQVMTEAGFRVLPSEWWHFNLVSREEAKRRLRVIE